MLLSDLKIHVFGKLNNAADLYFKNALSPNSINSYTEHILKTNYDSDYLPHLNLILMLNDEDYFNIFMQQFNIGQKDLANFIPYIKNSYTFDQIKITHHFTEEWSYRGYRVKKNHCFILKNRYGLIKNFLHERVLTEDERMIKNIIE